MVREVRDCALETPVNEYRLITSGWDNMVLEVEEKYIFRFPRSRGGWARILKEAALLPLLSRTLNSPVPDYRYVWGGSRRYPLRFAGYRKIAGESCAEASDLKTETLGPDLAQFLTELHSILPTRRVLELIPRYTAKTWAESRASFYRRIRPLVYPLLHGKFREMSDEFWAESMVQFSHAEFEPTLIHSDLRAGNIIVNPRTGRLNGVIDWDNAAVGDPALDFMGAFELSPVLGDVTLDNYEREKEGFRDRIDTYLRTVPFGEVAQGVRAGNRQLVKGGLMHLKWMFDSLKG